MRPAPPPASAPASAPRPTPTKSTPVSSSPPFGLERRAHGTPGVGNLRTIGAARAAGWISGLRPRDAEHQVVPRERGKVEIGAQYFLRSIGRFEGESEGDAELGSGDRQIGPRDLDLSRSFDRAAEVGLSLPVGALGRLHRLEARIAGARVALGLHVCADLQPVRADKVAAARARQL